MVTAQDFATEFHSLGGITPGEQRKQLHVLLLKTKESSGTDVVDFSAVKPRTLLEQNFKIEALIYFRRFRELLDVLRCENPIVIHKVLKTGSWFVKEVIKNITAEELVTKIFPFTSLNVKEKLLTQLAIHFDDPHKADEYFYAVKRTYGLYLAQRLLSACSDALILQHIKENKTEVTPRQLSTILDRYPQHTVTIFAYLNSHEAELAVGNKYRSVFIKLAKTSDTPSFLEVYKKYNPNIQLGPRGTRAFISKTKQDVIENPSKYHGLLNGKRIGRSLTNYFPKFYFKFFPKSINRLKNTMPTLMGLLSHIQSNSEKLHLILGTFQKAYGTELWEYSDLVTPELIEMMSPDERELWMTIHKKPQDITEEKWISYMKTDKSIPILKSKIAITSSMYTRIQLINALVKTCKINKDKTALIEVCKYILATHRNDNLKICEEFFTTLVESFDLTKLEDAQWNVLLECVSPFKAIKCRSFFNQIEEQYLYYRLRKGLPIDDQLQQWAKDMENSRYVILYDIPKFAKECLIKLSKYIPVNGNNKEGAKNSCYNYLKAIMGWNTHYRYDRISLFINPTAIDFIKEDLQSESFDFSYTSINVTVDCIVHEYEQSEKAGLVRLLLNRKDDNHYRSPIINWLTRNKPKELAAYADKIVEVLSNFQGAINLRHIYLSIREKIIADCYEVIEKMGTDYTTQWTAKNALILLSQVESSERFLKFVEKYHPTELSPDLFSDEGRINYKMLQLIFQCIHNIYPVTDTLDVFLKFCRGDYLKFAQKYLYCTVNHVCEDKLESYFDDLGRRAVSVRKHSRSLACQFLKRDRALEILKNATMTEKNASLRKGLFKIAFHYFLKNPDDQLWELAKQNFAKVNLDDSEAIKLLTTYKKVPRAYLKQYILFSWEALKRFPETNKALKEGKGRILEVAATPEFVSELPDEFFREIITGPFLDSLRKPLDHQASAWTLACKCLIYVQRDELTDLIFEKLQDFVTESGSRTNKRIQNFVEEFCSEFLEKKCLDQTPLLKFIKMWTVAWPLYKILDQYLHLNFTYIYLNALERSMTIVSIAEEVATFWDELYQQNLFVEQVFQASLETFKSLFFKVDQEEEDSIENQIIFIETVLKKPSTGRLILAIFFLPYNLENRIFITKYKEIIKVINQNSDPLVQIYLGHYFNKNKEWY